MRPEYNIPPQAGYEPDPNKRTFGGWLTSPEISQGLIGAGQAILNSGYGGNPAAAFGGFNEGMQKARQQRAERAYKMLSSQSLLGGGATGVLVKQYMNATGSDFPTALAAVKSNLTNQGLTYQNGEIKPIQGALPSMSAISGAKEGGKQKAQLDYIGKKEEEKAVGKEFGEKSALVSSQESKMPQLIRTVNKLSELGKAATYTYADQASDIVRRQLGMKPMEGALARTEYIATVDNEILPLLRDTFGAQFTENEGKSLKATLGDVNKSPEEKDVILRAFITAKTGQIESNKRAIGQYGNNIINEESSLKDNSGDPLGIR